MVALYAASLAPFAALKRSGPFTSQDALSSAIDGCDTVAGVDAASCARGRWRIGALTATKAGRRGGSPLAAVQSSFGTLRNVVAGAARR